MTSTKYILSVDDSYWRVKVPTPATIVSKCFSWAKYGGKDDALKMAQDYRDKILHNHGMSDRLEFAHSPHSTASENRENPVIGVYLASKKDRLEWTAKFTKGDRTFKKTFSCEFHGPKEAFLKACEARYQWAGILHVTNKDAMPCKPKVPYKLVRKE